MLFSLLKERNGHKVKKFFKEFKEFALKGNVMDLAVAVIIGAAFQGIINSVVKDLIMPVINWIFGGIDFSNNYIVLADKTKIVTEAVPAVVSGTDVISEAVPAVRVGDLTTLAALEENGIGVFKYGSFITAVINFVLMALVIFLLIKGINKLTSLRKKEVEEDPAPTTKICPFCKSEIDIEATRCPHCTSEQPAEEK